MEYKLKDGSIIEGPEPSRLNPEQRGWLTEQGVAGLNEGGWKDAAKSAVSGLAEGAVRAPFIMGDLWALGAQLMEKLKPGSTSERNRRSMSGEVLDVIKNETGLAPHVPTTTAGRYLNAGGNAVGGGAVFGIPGLAKQAGTAAAVNIGVTPGVTSALGNALSRTVRNPSAQNALIGVAGEAAGEIDPANPLLHAGGSAATALTAALAARALQPKAALPIYAGGKGTDWKAAAARTGELERAGTLQNTVADALPQTNQLRGLTRELSNVAGGQQLFEKLAGRKEGDIARLVDEARIASQQAAVPGHLPSTSISQAEELFRTARNTRTQAMLGELQGQPLVPETTLDAISRALREQAAEPGNNLGPMFPNHLRNAANVVDQVPRQPLTSPGVPRAAGPTPVTPLGAGPQAAMPPQGGVPLPGSASPQLAGPAGPVTPYTPPLREIPDKGWSTYQMSGRPDITDVLPPQGADLQNLSKAIKMLATTTPATDGTAATILKTADTAHASKVASDLLKQHSPAYTKAMGEYERLSPHVDIARLLAEGRLQANPNPAQMGMDLTRTREGIIEALGKINPAVQGRVVSKLDAADTLSQLGPQSSMSGVGAQTGQSTMATLLRPFTTLSNKANSASQIKMNSQLTHLLASPTPENLALLQALTARNPTLAQRLREITNLGAINASAERN